jgi:hypothetical protein
MKLAISVFFLVCAASAFGQSAGYISSQATPVRFQENPQHATNHDMATEQSLISYNSTPYHYEKGEQPVWQFGVLQPTQPLGDIARAVRKEKLTSMKRAEFVWED